MRADEKDLSRHDTIFQQCGVVSPDVLLATSFSAGERGGLAGAWILLRLG